MSIYAWLGAIAGTSLDPLNFIPALIIGASVRRYVFAAMASLALGVALSIAAYIINQRYGGISSYYVPAQIISSLLLTSIAFGTRLLVNGLRQSTR